MDLTGKPDNRGGDHRDPHRHGSRSMPVALWCVHGKRDRAGGPATACRVRYMEAGPRRGPYGIQVGSPTVREAHCRIYVDMVGGLGRRLYYVYKGSPTEREARC